MVGQRKWYYHRRSRQVDTCGLSFRSEFGCSLTLAINVQLLAREGVLNQGVDIYESGMGTQEPDDVTVK